MALKWVALRTGCGDLRADGSEGSPIGLLAFGIGCRMNADCL